MQKLRLKEHKDNKDEQKEGKKKKPIQNKDRQSKAMFSPWNVETI